MIYESSDRIRSSGSIANIMRETQNKNSFKKHFGNRLFRGNEIFEPEVWNNKNRRGSVDISELKGRNELAGIRYGQLDEVKYFNETSNL